MSLHVLEMHLVWTLGLFEKTEDGDARCKECPPDKKPLKNSKGSSKTLVTHLNLHQAWKEKYEKLVEDQSAAREGPMDAHVVVPLSKEIASCCSLLTSNAF